jgi:uncharacterized protein with ParB-like and HNH nuclease domain
MTENEEFNSDNLKFDTEEVEEFGESSIDELSKIVSYNVANTVEVLKFKIDNNEIELQPEFQRDFVWDINRASLFIDSLIIGLPIPSIFLGKSKEDETYKVIDGQQRLKSVYFYLNGRFKTKGKDQIFTLKNLEDREWNGKTYAELDDKHKRRIRNAVLNTTVIEDIDSNPRVVHDIFHRLNTGGMPLKDQEIRNCVYTGPFNTLLINLNNHPVWRKLLGQDYPDRRLRDVELILRYFALLYDLNSYSPSMREFLSQFQKNNRANQVLQKEGAEMFEKTITEIYEQLGPNAFVLKTTINKSVCDAIMVGLSQILKQGKTPISLKGGHSKLLDDGEFLKFVSASTSSESSVTGRITKARNYFLGV